MTHVIIAWYSLTVRSHINLNVYTILYIIWYKAPHIVCPVAVLIPHKQAVDTYRAACVCIVTCYVTEEQLTAAAECTELNALNAQRHTKCPGLITIAHHSFNGYKIR